MTGVILARYRESFLHEAKRHESFPHETNKHPRFFSRLFLQRVLLVRYTWPHIIVADVEQWANCVDSGLLFLSSFIAVIDRRLLLKSVHHV